MIKRRLTCFEASFSDDFQHLQFVNKAKKYSGNTIEKIQLQKCNGRNKKIFICFLDDLEVMEEESYKEIYGALCNFTTVLSNGVREELVPNGETKLVTSEEREKFAALVRRKRMAESTNQVCRLSVPSSIFPFVYWIVGKTFVTQLLNVVRMKYKWNQYNYRICPCISRPPFVKSNWHLLRNFAGFLVYMSFKQLPKTHNIFNRNGSVFIN